MTLPDGYTWRPMRLADAALVSERSAEYTSALLGFAKHSPEDVANYLRDPGTNPETDGWVVSGPDGFVGSATAVPITGGSHVNVDILSADPVVLDWLLERAEARGGDGAVVRVGAIRQDELLPGVLQARGVFDRYGGAPDADRLRRPPGAAGRAGRGRRTAGCS